MRKADRKACLSITRLFLTVCLGGVLSCACGTEPTHSADIRPILQRRCVNCHAPGEVAPMPLRTYSEVRPWARAIKEAVALRRMPPWHTVRAAHAFRNDRSLSPDEIRTIANWVDSGAAEGLTAEWNTAPTQARKMWK